MHHDPSPVPLRTGGAGIGSRIKVFMTFLCLAVAGFVSAQPPDEGDREYGCLAAAKHTLAADKTSSPVAANTINYDVREYRLSVTLDPDATEYTGEVYVRFAPVLQDFNEFVLDVVGLEVLSVTGGDGSLAFVQAGDSVVVDLPLAKLGADDSVTVAFRGELVEYNREGLGKWTHDWDVPADSGPCIATFSEPEFSRTWWPCKDRPYDKAPATIIITAPDDLTAVSNGLLESETDNGDGTRTWVWVESHPIAPYLISVAVSDYVHFGEFCLTPVSAIDLDHWVFPTDSLNAAVDFAPLCDMIDFMEGLVGPYPFADEKYGHAEYLNTSSGAMEHQTVTSYGASLITGNNSKDWIVVHELAHQWFGDSLTPETWPDIWLNEGFATYSEALWQEHLHGLDETGELGGYFWKMRRLHWGNDWIGQTTVYDPFPVLDRVVYDKGAWLLHMLRGRIGDTAFFDLLEDWATAGGRPGGVVDTGAFVALASAHHGADLSAFFDPWLYRSTVPHLEMDVSVDGGFGVGSELTVSLTDRSGVVFDNVYPLRVTTDAGEEWRPFRLVGAAKTEVFGFGSPVQEVALDPLGWVAWRSAAEAQTALRLLRTYPNPSFDGVLGVVYRLEHDDDLALQIYDARGRLVYERDIGLVLGTFSEQEVLWSGRDGEGRRVPSGVYWARLEAGGESSVIKFSVVR
ncbi:hypothetical protein KJ554_11170 [bacterium]|nr:hypothetical protein [bacterium]